jgi:Tol biopolymer transport system component
MVIAALAAIGWVTQSALPPIYFVRKDAVYSWDKGQETKIISDAYSPAVSPNGKVLAFLREGNLHSYDISDGLVRQLTTFPDKAEDDTFRDTFPSWDPSSKYVIFSHLDQYTVTRKGPVVQPLYGSESGTRSVWNVYWYWMDRANRLKGNLNLFLGNETSGLSKLSVVSSLAASFSPDGRKVAFCRNGDLWMADVDPSAIHNLAKIASWDEARVLPSAILEGGTRGTNETNAIFRIAWSPDGKLLAISSDRYTGSGGADIQIVRTDRPSETVVSFPGWDATFLDSNRILYVKPYTESENIWLYTMDSKDEKMLIPNASEPAVGKS